MIDVGDGAIEATTPDKVTEIEYDTDQPLTSSTTTLTTKEIDGVDVPGVWSFMGWYSTEEEAKAAYTALKNGETASQALSEKNIRQDEDVYGGYVIVPGSYVLTYIVAEDPEWGIPVDGGAPSGVTGIPYMGDETLEDALTTQQGYAEKDGVQVPGVWTFTGWRETADLTGENITEKLDITENQTVYGKWVFEPQTVLVTVTKVWKDSHNADNLRSRYGVTLYADGEPYGDEVILDKNTLTYTWDNLPKYGSLPARYRPGSGHPPHRNGFGR